MKKLGFGTRSIHGTLDKRDVHGSMKTPVYSGVAFEFDSAQEIEDVFRGRKPAHAYSRITNPTVEAFEKKVTSLENGLVSIATASGMAAISNAILGLIVKGDNIIAASNLFGGTYSLLKNTLVPLGIEVRFVDIYNLELLQSAIDENTRIIFFETIANPAMSVPDIQAITAIASQRDIVTIVDGTLTTPYLFDAKAYGVSVIVHSSTKYMASGASALGGVIVDLGNFNWAKVPALKKFAPLKQFAFIARLRKEVFRDIGACLPAQSAFILNLGLETLSLRMDRCCDNAEKIAQLLAGTAIVETVSYPGLVTSPYYELAASQFNGRFGSIIAFELGSRPAAFKFLDSLKLFKRATNLGDNTSLAIHPASTIFCEYTPDEKLSMGVNENMIRLSVGIEDADDLLWDIEQALSVVRDESVVLVGKLNSGDSN